MNNRYIYYIIFLIVIVVILIPIRISQSISVNGKIIPQKVFMLINTNNGSLSSVLINNKIGITEQYSNYQIERGDNFEVNIYPFENNSFVHEKSKIAEINSSVLNQKIIELKSELNNKLAYLKVLESSEKKELVKAAEKRLNYAEQKVTELLKIYKRQEQLLNKNLISHEDYEIAESNLNLAAIEVEIAKEELNAVSSGVKKEEIDLTKTEIIGMQQSIETLYERKSDYDITSPINGILVKNFNSDTLLTIQQTTNSIFSFAVKIEDANQIYINQNVNISISGAGTLIGNVFHIERTARYFNGSNYLIIQVESNIDTQNNILNASVIGEFELESKTLLDIILGYFSKEFAK